MLQIVLNEDSQAAELLATEVHKKVSLDNIHTKKPGEDFVIDLKDVGIWIDPIGTIIIRKHPIFTLFLDSTAEYINGVEEVDVSGITISGLKCVTVLIGVYDKKSGLPIIGIINQPFVENNGKR